MCGSLPMKGKGVKNIKNEYEIRGEFVAIFLKNRKGNIQCETLIDTEDLERIKELGLNWCARFAKNTKSYYAQANICVGVFNGRKKWTTKHLNTYVMNTNKGDKIDHLNHDTLDNRKSNLKMVTNKRNIQNRHGANRNNKTSGHRNISLVKGNRWIVQIQINGKNTRVGTFKYENLDKAIELAKEVRLKYYGEDCDYEGETNGT